MTRSANISAEEHRRLFTIMQRIRLFEDRIAVLYSEQQMKCPVHLCIGEEAIAAGVCIHLKKKDYIFSTHRSHGHCIAKGSDFRPIAAELYGRSNGCSRGRGGSMHLTDPENGILGTTAIVGGCIPLAAGAGLASMMRKDGRVSVAFFGDGAMDEGVFHETLNFASLKQLPVVFVCENNFYATNSHQRNRQPDVSIAGRAAGFGIPGRLEDGNDVMAVYDAAGEAIERARSGGGPTLLEFTTYRWKAHVGPNPDVESGCRPKEEYDEWINKCPLDRYEKFLMDSNILSEKEMLIIEAGIEKEIDDAIEFGKNGPMLKPEELYDHVY